MLTDKSNFTSIPRGGRIAVITLIKGASKDP